MTFSGKDLNVVPITLVIDIADNIENMDNTTTSVLVERYNTVSIFSIKSTLNWYICFFILFHFCN